MLLALMVLSFIASEKNTLILTSGDTFVAPSAGTVPSTSGWVPSGTAQAVPAKAIIPTTRAPRVAINDHLAFTTSSLRAASNYTRTSHHSGSTPMLVIGGRSSWPLPTTTQVVGSLDRSTLAPS